MKTTTKINIRPTCTLVGCKNPAQLVSTSPAGRKYWRKLCATHHLHTHDPALKHRKTYCQNVDGRLGFLCTTTIHWPGMLDVDHRNGNPSDNRPRNLQTLCKCCHAYKSHLKRDHATPGRKTLKLAR